MSGHYDVIIIGAGILGCFAARHLAAYDLKTLVLEKREDVCTGITKANSGIIYEGYDQHPGSLKAELCVKANRNFEDLCAQLDVPYKKPGLMMLSFGPEADAVLEKKLKKGLRLGLDHLKILSGAEVYEREPGLCEGVKHALYSENTYVADPWKLGIAAYENAAANGVEFRFGEEVTAIIESNGDFAEIPDPAHARQHYKFKSGISQANNSQTSDLNNHFFEIATDHKTYAAKRVLCCAGLKSDAIWEMAREPAVRIVPQYADYIVFDTKEGKKLNHIISVEPEKFGEGVTILPTADGNVLLGPTRRDGNLLFGSMKRDDSTLFGSTSRDDGQLCGKPGKNMCAGSFDLADERVQSLPAVNGAEGGIFPSENGILTSETALKKMSGPETSIDGLEELARKCRALLPEISFDSVIRSFGAVRPNPYFCKKTENGVVISDKSVNDFLILEENGFFALIGVKTPGITCSNELGRVITERLVSSFDHEIKKNPDFNPERRRSSSSDDTRIVCRCKGITYAEIKEAIRRGASTIDGVKRRTDAGMGRCQGGNCMEKVLRMISAETGKDIYEITKDGAGSEVLIKRS